MLIITILINHDQIFTLTMHNGLLKSTQSLVRLFENN